MNEIDLAADHEAAHALMRYRRGLPIAKITIDEDLINAEGVDARGYVSGVLMNKDVWEYLQNLDDEREQKLLDWCIDSEILAFLAGPVMDHLNSAQEYRVSGEQDDIGWAIDLIFHFQGGTDDLTPWQDRAKSLICESLPAIRRLASELKRQKTLGGAEAEAVLAIDTARDHEPVGDEILAIAARLKAEDVANQAALRMTFGTGSP
ncbi:MAG TPA: hypothetical protein VMV90_00305 [Rectinemataceae bacterium]|nr:hypothetical protein [Rectinemataceae bacterium]